MPSLKPPIEIDAEYGADFEDYAVETNEWLSLVLLNSPRLHPDDNIDPYLSRYQPPGDWTDQKLVKVTWQGFIAPSWAHHTFVDLLLAVPVDSWFAYSIAGFEETWMSGGKASMILRLAEASSEYMLWDIA